MAFLGQRGVKGVRTLLLMALAQRWLWYVFVQFVNTFESIQSIGASCYSSWYKNSCVCQGQWKPFLPISPKTLLQWDNVNGDRDSFDDDWHGRGLFEQIRRVAGGEEAIIDSHYSIKASPEEKAANMARYLMTCQGHPMDYKKVDYRIPIPNSEQMRLFSWDEVREFNQSAYKRTLYLRENWPPDQWISWVGHSANPRNGYDPFKLNCQLNFHSR